MREVCTIKMLVTAVTSLFLTSILSSVLATPDINNDFSEAVEVKNNDVITESLDESDDLSDYFKIYLEAEDVVEVIVAVPYGQDFDLYLYDESYDLRNKSEIDNPGTDEYFEEVFLNATYTGWYYIEVYAFSGAGDYLLFAYATAEWTIMIYLDGDNDLETEAIVDFMEMSEVGSTDDVNIVVQFDRISGYDGSYGGWTGCERFLVTQGMTPEVANSFESLGEVNMGSSQTLIDFGNMAVQSFPANRYALVLWDHGDSWLGVCWDESSSYDRLTMPELNASLSTIVSANSLSTIDVLWFDACFMASMEVAYEVADYCSSIVGSEMVEPGTGANYELTLTALTSNPFMTSGELCQQIVSDFVNSYDSTPEPGYIEADVTQSAINSSNVSTLAASVDALSNELAENVAEYINYIRFIRFKVEYYDLIYADLHDIAWKMSEYLPSGMAKTYAFEVMAAVNNTVFAEDHWDMPGEQRLINATGLMIYFPIYSPHYYPEYESGEVAFPPDTHWDEFLSAYPFLNDHIYNSPPLIVNYDPLGDSILTEGQSQTFSVEATDSDGNALSYSWYVDEVLSAKDVASFEYTPGFGDAGSHSVRVDVWDGNLTDSHTWSVEVEEGDDVPPSSCVIAPIAYWTVSAPMTISAEASDDSGTVSEVSLWYRHSIDNSTWGAWTEFGIDSYSPWEWSFDFPEGNGYYEFYSTAIDDSSNQEDPPPTADAQCAYDGSPPVASFAVNPLIGDIITFFEVNASYTSDFRDTIEELEVRWDWEDDGVWDTDWTTEKTATHQYTVPGTYTVKLEVRDTDGLTDYATATVEVVEVIPEFSGALVPVLSLLLVVALVAWRRRTKTDS